MLQLVSNVSRLTFKKEKKQSKDFLVAFSEPFVVSVNRMSPFLFSEQMHSENPAPGQIFLSNWSKPTRRGT